MEHLQRQLISLLVYGFVFIRTFIRLWTLFVIFVFVRFRWAICFRVSYTIATQIMRWRSFSAVISDIPEFWVAPSERGGGIASFTVFMMTNAPCNCLNAHSIIISGAMRETSIRYKRQRLVDALLSRRKGTFGCTETHVQANVVAKQLQRMSHSDLLEQAPIDAVVAISKADTWMVVSGKLGVRMGKAHVPALLESRKERSSNIPMIRCL